MWSLGLAVLITTCTGSLVLIITKSLGSLLMSDTPPHHNDWVSSTHLFSPLKAASLSQPPDTYIIESFSLGSLGIENLFSILYH